ncbi:MAG: hypothetical protein NTZ87_04345 [Candidatus Nomurabacteria bacterium]|nr:hypothetical protein [Candidatus Nomurabacteria bacterium]
MKKLLTLSVLVSVLVLTSVSLFGQTMPKGQYVAQPWYGGYGDEGRCTKVMVHWTDHTVWPMRCCFKAEFGDSGEVKTMYYIGGSADKGTDFEFVYPAKTGEANLEFKTPEVWKAFASQVIKEFVFIDAKGPDFLYLEKKPFTLVERSIAFSHHEISESLQFLIFKKEERWLVVPLSIWKGPQPLIGNSVIIGQTGHGDYFFPVKKFTGDGQPDEYLISPEMREQEEADIKEAQKYTPNPNPLQKK